jgi:exodeoxyribonuclease V gamma subunit
LQADTGDVSIIVQDAAEQLRQQGQLPAGGFGTLILDAIADNARGIAQRWQTATARWPETMDGCELRYPYGELTVEGWLDDVRLGVDGSLARLQPHAGKLLAKKDLRYDKLIYAWVVQLLANASDLPLSTCVLATDATVVLKPCTPEDARVHLNRLIDAWRDGMQQPLPIASRTAFAWLIAERAAKDPRDAARAAYEGSDVPQAPAGEMEYERYLARTWQSFDALFADGFEHWLALYRPLLDAANAEEHA